MHLCAKAIRSLHSTPPLRAFRPWESSGPACELFLLATQMYFFYLIVNRVDVCTSNSSKIYKWHPCHWCSFLRGNIPLVGQSQRPQGGRSHRAPTSPCLGNSKWSWGEGERSEKVGEIYLLSEAILHWAPGGRRRREVLWVSRSA